MLIWRGCGAVPGDLAATCVTIGNFDGVHRGHRILLDRTVAAAASGLAPVAVTFDPHPMAVLRPQDAPLLLTTMDRRLELIAAHGLAATLVLPFTRELAELSAERFATAVLARTLHARRVVVGGNFRFGHRAAGDVPLLAELGRELGFTVDAVDLATLGEGEVVSSTAVRAMVAAGDVVGATAALGRAHRVHGLVVHGDHRGRELGYPTANLAVPDDLAVPGDGVYAARLRASGDPGTWLPAAVSVGTNPTFSGAARRVEAFVIDAPADLDLYGQQVDLDLVAHLRPMIRFASIPDLLAAMAGDVSRARAILGPTAASGPGAGDPDSTGAG